MSDPYHGWGDSPDAPARRLARVAPSDSSDLPSIPKALWVAEAGTVQLVAVSDTSNQGVPMGELQVGTVIPVRARRVNATGTTAALVAFY